MTGLALFIYPKSPSNLKSQISNLKLKPNKISDEPVDSPMIAFLCEDGWLD
jgi:hypothetical protein